MTETYCPHVANRMNDTAVLYWVGTFSLLGKHNLDKRQLIKWMIKALTDRLRATESVGQWGAAVKTQGLTGGVCWHCTDCFGCWLESFHTLNKFLHIMVFVFQNNWSSWATTKAINECGKSFGSIEPGGNFLCQCRYRDVMQKDSIIYNSSSRESIQQEDEEEGHCIILRHTNSVVAGAIYYSKCCRISIYLSILQSKVSHVFK